MSCRTNANNGPRAPNILLYTRSRDSKTKSANLGLNYDQVPLVYRYTLTTRTTLVFERTNGMSRGTNA